MAEYIELIDKYLIVQSEDTDYNPPSYDWVDNTGKIVRCRDCVHYEMGVCLKIYDDGAANKDAWQERKPDDYCSYGEDRNVPTKESEEVSAVRCWLPNGADMRPTSTSGANGEES